MNLSSKEDSTHPSYPPEGANTEACQFAFNPHSDGETDSSITTNEAPPPSVSGYHSSSYSKSRIPAEIESISSRNLSPPLSNLPSNSPNTVSSSPRSEVKVSILLTTYADCPGSSKASGNANLTPSSNLTSLRRRVTSPMF